MTLIKIAGIAIPILIVLAVIGAGAFFIYKLRYRTARSNEALIITGTKLGDASKETNIFTDGEGRSMKIIRGGGHLLWTNQTATPVSLTSFQLKMTTPKVYTSGGVPIVADAVATVTVSSALSGIAIYAEQFLGKKQSIIEEEISEVLGANLRAILSKLTVEEIMSSTESFNTQVTEIAQRQLDQMGFKITSLGLTDLRDADKNNGYLENLGRPLIAEAQKTAEIAEANNEKQTRIHKANAQKEAQEQEIMRSTEIAEANKQKDLKASVILEETQRAQAKAEQSYALEKARLAKEVQEEELKLLAQKKEEELRIQQLTKEREVRIEEEQNKIRKAQADADYYDKTKNAEAEARKSEIDGAADAKVSQEKGLAEANVSRQKGLAEAEVILKRGEAEATSKRLLAEAIAEHGEVVLIEKMIEMIPLYAEKIAAPLSRIDSVKIIDTGSGDGVNAYSKSIMNTMTSLQEPLQELTGINMSQMMKDLVNRGNTHTVVTPSVEQVASNTSESIIELPKIEDEDVAHIHELRMHLNTSEK